jgi:filamentous hemagglutinin family protein
MTESQRKRTAARKVPELAGQPLRAVARHVLRVAAFLALVTVTHPAHGAGSLTQRGATPAPVTASIAANLTAQAQAASVAQQSANTLSHIANALRAMQTAQTAAQTIAQGSASTVPNGLAPGGLVPDSGLAATGVANPVRSWINAQTPTQTTSGGRTNVSITQTAAQAILSWNDFNVGKNTTVTFNQQQSSWTALNQIAPSGVPSQILGAIKAAGQVYLINQNGIIFGGASQINVGALVASSAAISDSQFTTNGIYGSTYQGTSQSGGSYTAYNPSFTNAGGGIAGSGKITVDEGAQITTAAPASVTTGGGFVLLLGTTVSNAGTISTPNGQTALAAGDDFFIRPGFNTSTNQTSTTRGNEIAINLNAQGSSLAGGSGAVTNTGYISADIGDITLLGESVAQDGVAVSTTSVSVRGTIHLLSSASDPFGNVTLGAGSLTLIEPDLADSTTALDSQRAALIAASAGADGQRSQDASPQFDDLSLLADQEQDSRVEIVSGNTVEFQGGSQTIAFGGQVAVSAVNRIQTDTGALIDVAGSYGVALPVSANDIAVSIQSFETRDNPQNRLTQLLRNNTVYVDQRDLTQIAAGAGGYASTRDYTAGGVLEVSGYLATTGHTIGEWTAIGGNITFATGKAGAIVAQSGAVFNVDGGSIAYQPGEVQQSYFLGQNGRVYNVNTAPAYITYAGVFDGFVDNHPAWGVSQTYANVLSDPTEVAEPGYTVGRNAGALTLDSPTTLFSATIDAGVVNGPNQTKAAPAGFNATYPLNNNDPYTLAQNIAAEPGALDISGVGGDLQTVGNTNVSFANNTATPADGLTAASAIASGLTGTTTLNAMQLDQSGLGALSILTNGRIDVAAALTLAPGATVSLQGATVTVAAPLTAPSGTVTIEDEALIGSTLTELGQFDPATGKIHYGDITLADGGVINTAGLWTNLALDPNSPNDSAFVNGGAVTLKSVTNLYDDAGSLIDASAGAVIAANGAGNGGSGGAITLTPVNLAPAIPLTSEIPTGNLILEGTLESIGFSTGGGKAPGGALTLASPTFLIGAAPYAEVPGIVTLQPGFFSSGFSSYTLIGQTAVTAGTILNVVEPTEQFTPAAQTVPTGGAVSAGATLALLPVYAPNAQVSSLTQRPGASLTITGGNSFDLVAGTTIAVDPGSSIAINAYGQITIDGDLSAPSGTIKLTNDLIASNGYDSYANGGTLSIWVGATGTIDTAAIPFTASNAKGNSVATAPSGGNIDIAGSEADVIIQAGALLDAAGSAAVEQPATDVNPSPVLGAPAPAKPAIMLAGAGGTIALSSDNSLFLDGTMLAPAGGPNAAGGTLALSLNTDGFVTPQNTPDAPRILTITSTDTAAPLPADLTPGSSDPALAQGIAQISTAQIAAGGFGTLNFTALSAFLFEGDVLLRAAQSITLAQGAIADSTPTGSVTVAAPYVVLSGTTSQQIVSPVTMDEYPASSVNGISPVNSTGAFNVDAGLIITENDVSFGGIETVPTGTGPDATTQTTDLNGFANINLDSAGEIDVLGGNILTSGNIDLTASLIHGSGTILAGFTQTKGANGNFLPGGRITIGRTTDTTPRSPDEIGNSLYLDAANILDAGVIWEPDGKIFFGLQGNSGSQEGGSTPVNDPNTRVELLAGSDTSVSAAGLAIPYGGTTDGVNFSVEGTSVTAFSIPGSAISSQSGAITFESRQVNVARGADIDLSGGGTFNGAGFITGAGGSVDVLTTPLLQVSASGVSAPTLATDQVYAIVAGPQPQIAPASVDTQTGATASTPQLGEQIIIPAGVPGLPAGRYTLLPAAFALNAGGYRVEFDGAASLSAPAVSALPNGSYAVAGQTGIAGTNVQSALPDNFTITPVAAVLDYADYDTENITTFALAKAAQFGASQPFLPADAGTLTFNFPSLDTVDITNVGAVDFAPASGGNGGTLVISGIVVAGETAQPDFEIYGAMPPAPQTGTIALSAPAIDNFNAATIEIGIKGAGADQNGANAVKLDHGATLTASRVIFTAGAGGITLQPGAEIDTLGRASLISDSTTLGPLSDRGNTVLDVGNGYLAYDNAGGGGQTGNTYGPVDISAGATIYTDGSIAISTGAGAGAGVTVEAGANLGAAYLDLAVPQINVGDPAVEGSASQPGLDLTQAELNTLTEGVPGAGVPATKILDLTAGQSLNFFGTTALDLSASNVTLVINTPAIYGIGAASDVAAIKAGTIVWNGDSLDEFINGNLTEIQPTPGPILTNGPGNGLGTLDFDAGTIIFGYSSLDQPARHFSLNRIALGFATVNLNATAEVTANNQGTLAVYESQPVFGSPGIGGALNINTPLLTGGNAATIGFTAGDLVKIAPPAGAMPAHALVSNAAGAEIDLSAPTVTIGSAIILPSGKLNIQATGDIIMNPGADLDLAGETSTIEGHTSYGAGGSLIAESSTGNITQAAGAAIDVAAIDNNAGSIALTAMAAGQGAVTLDGTLTGSTSGATPGSSGTFNIRAQTLGGSNPDTAFAGLNAALDTGGIFGTRDFEIGQGNLNTVGGVSAKTVSITLDDGSLTVIGTIDAAYGSAGSISLAASDNLTLAAGAVLDAQGQTLQTDSYGQPIAAADASQINLTATNGTVLLSAGATLNLASADGVARGDLEINVPRNGANTVGNADIQADTGLNITGAATVAVNAFETYQVMPEVCTAVPCNPFSTSGNPVGLITQTAETNPTGVTLNNLSLDSVNADSTTFIDSANTNQDLAARLAGLTGLGSIFHLRPGVDITGTASNEDLTIQGDIDLSGFRYGPAGYRYGNAINPAIYGSGEPGVLIIRTGGNLNIYGSITDGFTPPKNDSNTPFGTGWILQAGTNPYSVDVVIPNAVTLAAGTSFAQGSAVNYAVPIGKGQFQPNEVVPFTLTIDDTTDADHGAQPVTTSFVATSLITEPGPNGTTYHPGQLVPAFTDGVQNYLPKGTTIAPGGVIPFGLYVAPVNWLANTPFEDIPLKSINDGNDTVILEADLTLAPGSIIPASADVKLPNGAKQVNLRPVLPVVQGADCTSEPSECSQGQIYPLGQLLPAGDLSWSIQLVSGANTASADTGAVQAASALGGGGDMTLADTHYFNEAIQPITAFSVIRTGTGSLSLISGGGVTEDSDYGVYTAGNSVYAQGAEAGSPYNLPQGLEAPDGTLLGHKLAPTALLAKDYQANYTQDGGNVLLSAQDDINGFVYALNSVTNAKVESFVYTPTDSLLSWLSQQGGAGEATAWSVDFGALEPVIYTSQLGNVKTSAQMIGFQGIGTLGGGDLTVQAGGNASGLNLAVASTGRVSTSTGALSLTGGGNLNVDIGGGLNTPSEFQLTSPSAALGDTAGSVVAADLRGDTSITSGSIGFIVPLYLSNTASGDPRTISPLQTEKATEYDGIDLAPGDGTVTLDTRGDAVISGVQNPGLADTDYTNLFNSSGLVLPINSTPNSLSPIGGGLTSFSLWSATTAITLRSAGGDASLGQQLGAPLISVDDFYPPSFAVIAQNGNIDFPPSANNELAPAVSGTLDLLAGGSIYGNGSLISVSGASPGVEATPFDPAIQVFDPQTGTQIEQTAESISGNDLIYFGYDTPSSTTTLHLDGQAPALVLANTDIVGLTIGNYTPATSGSAAAPPLYLAALPFNIEAGRDIVALGSYVPPARTISEPSLFLNLGPNDFTTITAGRDILESSAFIAGPGTLLVQAGRDIYQAASGSLESLGPVINVNPANRDGGAGITVIAGAGAAGPDYGAFADLYVNPDSTLQLEDSAAILAENDLALYTYLQSNFGYTGTPAGAYAAFQRLSPNAQNAFLLTIYYAMLNQSGLEFNNPSSVRYKSYLLGQNAAANLFPNTLNGRPITYAGDLTMFSSANGETSTSTNNSGIHTDFGGAIQVLTPGGQTVVGVSGVAPEEDQSDDQGVAGVITQGSGAINIYALSNVLLGESRILTTFGGNILIWSAEGNINAGIGNKTGINVPPVEILYDNYGNIVLSPTVPTTGAGIGTLNPIPQVAAGNINLVAPLGTVDAGEAGIRVSGNLNIAAAHVENGANIQVQGSSAGVPTAPSVNVSANLGANSAAGASANAAESTGKTSAASSLPSIWIVDILGYGSQGSQPEPPQKKRKAHVVELIRNSFG